MNIIQHVTTEVQLHSTLLLMVHVQMAGLPTGPGPDRGRGRQVIPPPSKGEKIVEEISNIFGEMLNAT